MVLGLETGEFWELTPREYDALLGVAMVRERAQRLADNIRVGEVIAAIYNVNRDAKKHPEPLTWRDIFPDPEERALEMTEEAMVAALDRWADACEGTG